MEKLLNKFLKSSIITSIVLIVLGILLFFESEATIVTISYIIGAILIAIGVIAFISYVQKSEAISTGQLDIAYGIVSIVLGIIVIIYPHAIASIIPIVLGIGIIISSAIKLQYSFELKNNDNDLWKATMIISIVSTICGIVLLFNPFKGAVILTKVIGIFIIVYAVLDIVSTMAIKKNVTDLHKAINKTIADAEIINETTSNDTKASKKSNKKSNK